MEEEKVVLQKEEIKDGPGKRRRVAEILSRFLRWRPSEKDLHERNILKNNIDTSKSALERNQAKKKLTHMFGQYNKTQAGAQKKAYPQIGIEPSKLAEMFPDQPNGIPRVLTACFAYLEKNLQFEGLFRVTGSHIQITNLRTEVENGNFDAIDKCLAPQTVTGMVSLFFRQLPQPLIPYDMFDEFMVVGGLATENERIEALRDLTEKLPPANYRIMIVFMRLLKKIAQNSAANMMPSSNLGLVWGPTLLQAVDPMLSMVGNNLTRSCSLVELMIGKYDKVFPSVALSPPSSPPPQRPAPPTAPSYTSISSSSTSSSSSATPSPISPRTRTIGRTITKPPTSLASSSELLPPPSLLGPPPSSPLPIPPVTTPSRPPIAARHLGSLSRTTGASVSSSLSSSLSSTPPNLPPPPPPIFSEPPTQVYTPLLSSIPPPLSSVPPPLSSSPSTGTSSPARPPRPPRTATAANFSLSPMPSRAHARILYEKKNEDLLPGAQVIARFDTSPDLTRNQNEVPIAPPLPPISNVNNKNNAMYMGRRTIGSKPPARIPPPPPPSAKAVST